MTTYDRPQKAELHVHLENGETWKATDEDLKRFGLSRDVDAYARFDDALRKVLIEHGLLDRERGETTDAHLNALRYLVETAIVFPELLDHPEHEGWSSVAAIERHLAENAERVP